MTQKKYPAEEKVRIVLPSGRRREGLRGETSIAALRRREGIPSNHRYIILDFMMPEMDGYEITRISRGDHNTLINQRSEGISRYCIRWR